MNGETNTKRRTKRIPVLIIAMLLLLVVIGVFVGFFVNKNPADTSTIDKVLNLDSSEIEEIRIASEIGILADFSDRDMIDEIVNHIDNFKYISSEEHYPENYSGYDYFIGITINGEQTQYQFSLDSITVGHVRYYCEGDYMKKLADLASPYPIDKALNLYSPEIDEIRITNIAAGVSEDFSDRSMIDEIVNHINNFKYITYDEPPPENYSEYEYYIGVTIDGEQTGYQFSLDSITVDNVIYFCGGEYMRKLADLAGTFPIDKVLNLDSAEIDEIRITNNSTGVSVDFSDRIMIDKIVNHINNFKYISYDEHYTENSFRYYYYIDITIDGEQTGYQFSFDYIIIDNVKYYCQGEYMRELTNLGSLY